MKSLILFVMFIFASTSFAETITVGQQGAGAIEAQEKAERLLESRLRNACASQGGIKESRFDGCKIENGLGSGKRAECKATYYCNNPR